MRRKLIIILIAVAGTFNSNAQDAHLSIYDAAPMYLNPALTGVFKGDWRIHGQYRTQWKSVNFEPYTSALVSFDMPMKKWGFGLQLWNFRAGAGNFNAFQGTASVAYTTAVDRNKNHNISFGLQGGLTQKSLEYQLLTFNNQYTTQGGGTFDTGISSEEQFPGQSFILPNVNAGFMYFYANQQSRLNPFIGVSAFNLLEPRETFLDSANNLPMRMYVHAGTRVNITETFYLIPKVLVMQQREFWEQTYAVDAGYYLKGSDMYLLGGAVFRNRDALVVSLGARMSSFIAKVGYDINVSSLSTASTGRGGFELSFTYMKQKKKPTTEKICPRL